MSDRKLPSQIDLIGHICKAFGKRQATTRQINAIINAADSILEAFQHAPVIATPDCGLIAWLSSDETGLSSLWLAGYLTGQKEERFAYPHDSADFSRCVKMLQCVPEARAKLHKLRLAPKPWPAIAAQWPYYEGLLKEGNHQEVSVWLRRVTQ